MRFGGVSGSVPGQNRLKTARRRGLARYPRGKRAHWVLRQELPLGVPEARSILVFLKIVIFWPPGGPGGDLEGVPSGTQGVHIHAEARFAGSADYSRRF